MERKIRVALGIAVVAGLALVFTGAGAQPQPPAKGTGQKANPAQVKRGAYLVRTMGCNDCHTPMKFDQQLGMPVPDMSRELSGHPQGAPDPQGQLGQGDQALFGPTFTAIKLPFGTVYSANLTPSTTGIGDWTEKIFLQAMRTGRHLGQPNGRPILPPMPWMDIAAATDEDLRAVFAYLRSIRPIDNAVPDPKVPPEALQKIQKAYEAAMRGGSPSGGSAAPAPKK